MWKVGKPIGASDHEPILTTLQEKCEFQPVLPKKARWKTKGVDMNLWAKKWNFQISDSAQLETVHHRKTHELEVISNNLKTSIQ